MIRPEQIPDEVVKEFYGTSLHGIIPEILVKALNAWPGMVQNYSWDGSRWRIVLPGSQEGGDA